MVSLVMETSVCPAQLWGQFGGLGEAVTSLNNITGDISSYPAVSWDQGRNDVHGGSLFLHLNRSCLFLTPKELLKSQNPYGHPPPLQLIISGNSFEQMPLLNCQFLRSYREQRLAHLVLSFITMGYVWQEGETQPKEVKNK